MNIFTKLVYWNVITLIFTIIFSIIGCEKFTGYHYSVEEFELIAEIHGKVTNIYTKEPVYLAKVDIGSIITQTDKNGEYTIYYKLDESENRDKPVPVKINSPNYQVYIDSLILYPTKNILDVKLVYAAPIIQKQILYEWHQLKPTEFDSTHYDTSYVCQVLVYDYQGESDIQKVVIDFVYHDVVLNLPRFDTVTMNYAQKESENAAYFHKYYKIISVTNWQFQNKCSIKAFDKSGYYGSSIAKSTSIEDSLLIPLEEQ